MRLIAAAPAGAPHSLKKGKEPLFMSKTKKNLCIIGAAVLVPVLIIVLVVNITLNKIKRLDGYEQSMTEEEYSAQSGADEDAANYATVDENRINWGEKLDIEMKGNSFNVLLIGTDLDENYTSRSDTMIVCNVNLDTKKVTLISFLRDCYVQIPEHKDNKLNAAYAFGGVGLLDKTLEENFGVTVDANVLVDFKAFQKVIDALGGVEVYLFSDECNYVNSDIRGKNYKEGYCLLDGEAALSYCRIRSLDSDFGRTARQRKVLTALYNKFHTITLKEALEIIDKVFPLVTTDITNSEMVSYAVKLLPLIRECEIAPEHIPADGTWENANVRGMAVLILDFDKNRALLKDIIEGE